MALLTLLAAASAPGDQARGAERPIVRQELPATANDLGKPRAQNSPVLVADPTNARFVALANRLDNPGFSCALQVSGDGGRGWQPTNPVPELPPGAERCYAPEIAFDRDGTLYYLFLGLRGRGNNPMGVFLTTSDDHGQSFSTPRRLLGPGNYQVRMALDPTMGERGRIHLAWLRVSEDAPTGGLPPPPNPILSAYSDDGGESLSRPIQVSDPRRDLSVAPALALGPDHAVYVVYYDLQEDRRDYQGLEGSTWPGTWSLVSTTSRDGGRSFSRGVVVDERLRPPERVLLIYTMPPPALVAGESGVYAAWHDARNGDWDAFLSRSGDEGRSWGPPTRLNDDRLRNGRDQYLPRLSLAPDGRLDAIFYDRRSDPKDIRVHVYYTYSRDRGRQFSPNLKLTSAPSDSRFGQRYLVPSAQGRADFGSRIALLSRDASALAAWTDTRNPLAPLPQDIFATEVVFSEETAMRGARAAGAASVARPPAGWLALGALLSACAATVGLLGRGRARRAA